MSDELLIAARSLFAKQSQDIGPQRRPIRVVIFGAMAAHYWRVNARDPAVDREALEIQAQFEVRTFRTTEQVSFVAPGTNTSMWVRFAPGDPTKSTFLHPRYEERLITVDAFGEYDNLAIHALSPVDLAVSRLARFSELDQLEIRGLLRAGLFSAAELDRIATETLNVYLSRTSDIAANLRAALQLGPRDFGE